MNIVLYNNASPTNKAVKNLTQVATLDGYLREGTSIVNPHIMVEQTTLPSFNYVSIEAFNRSYFVESIININVKLWEIVLHCDVLSTFWNSIKQAPCIVSRSETKRIDKLIDNEIWTTVDSLYGTIEFPNEPFSPNENQGDIERYVLILAGSGKAGTTSTLSFTPPTGYYVRNISANGISYNRTDHLFYIPLNFTSNWSFDCEFGTGSGVLDFYNVTWDGTNWTITQRT